jgi:RNA polymerase sigma factor (sigma-70 family)
MGNAAAARRAAQPPVAGQALRILKDEKLASMVAAGSDDAFAVLYQRHHQPIYRYCLSLLRQEADARDALQSTMLSALSSLRARPIDGAFKPWLFRIAHNESISIVRGRTREVPDMATLPAAMAADPEAREQFRTLVADIGALPERQRGAIVMRELSGLSYATIAAALGTSEAGGKQLVYEARSALHELREGHEMSCELVRERLSANDRRLLRGRKVRAHLRACEPCQDFEAAIRRRRTAFAAFAPPLAPLAAAAVLQDVFAGGGGAGGAGGAGAAAGTAGFAAGGGMPLAGVAGMKAVAAVVVAGTAAVGAYAAGNAIFAGDSGETVAGLTEPSVAEGATREGTAAKEAGGARKEAGPKGGHHAGGAAAGERSSAAPGGEAPSGDSPAATGAAGGPSAASEPGGANTGGSGGDNSGTGGGGQPQSTPPTAPSVTNPHSPPSPHGPPADHGPGSDPNAAPGTPPGHGGTSPGGSETPSPGQVETEVPPGHLGNPGGGPPL